MAAFSMAAGASGALGNIKTTVLLLMTEGFEAAKKASSMTYRPPGQQRILALPLPRNRVTSSPSVNPERRL